MNGTTVELPGPGTGMALASGIAAYGAGIGEITGEFWILLAFIISTLAIEAIAAFS